MIIVKLPVIQRIRNEMQQMITGDERKMHPIGKVILDKPIKVVSPTIRQIKQKVKRKKKCLG